MCRGIDDGREINIHLFAETEKTKQKTFASTVYQQESDRCTTTSNLKG